MKKEYESNIILRNDNGESLRIAKSIEDDCFTIGTDEEVYFSFDASELISIVESMQEVVNGRKE